MAESEENRDLTKQTGEQLESTVPLALQYLYAVDEITNGYAPSERNYLNILVYAKDTDQPRIHIYRKISTYKNGTGGVSDVIIHPITGATVRIIAEKRQNGEYTEYTNNFTEAENGILGDTSHAFGELVKENGSEIRVNNSLKFVSQNGIWIAPNGQQESLTFPRLS